MTDVLSNAHNSDKVSVLVKEAENLKSKLEEERQKLNDVARELKLLFAFSPFPGLIDRSSSVLFVYFGTLKHTGYLGCYER